MDFLKDFWDMKKESLTRSDVDLCDGQQPMKMHTEHRYCITGAIQQQKQAT